MSLILEALRKSEAERHRGQSPDLFSAMPAPGKPRRSVRPRPWLWILACVLVLALATGGWYWFMRATPTAPAANEKPANIAQAPPAKNTVAATPADAPIPTPADNSSVPATEAGTPVATEDVAKSTPPNSLVALFPRQLETALPKPSATTAPPPVPAAPSAAPPAPHVVPAAPPAAASAPIPAAAGPRPATPSPATPAALPIPPPAPVPAQPAASRAYSPPSSASDEALPSLAMLGSKERSELPPYKLSMHVWAGEPGKRFAIIDGQRVIEGSVATGAVVEEIRRDGVVLNIRGRRFLLPRP